MVKASSPSVVRKTLHLLGLLSLVSVGSLLFIATKLPNSELSFSRSVNSPLPPERLDRNLAAFNRWPEWFYSLDHVSKNSLVDHPATNQTQEIRAGDQFTLFMDPKRGSRKRYELRGQVLEYSPARRLRLKIFNDSSERLTRIFESLEWQVDLEKQGSGSLIRGRAIGVTKHWRSRFFGLFAEKILMNQVFYPNLIHLAELRQPFSLPQVEPRGVGF